MRCDWYGKHRSRHHAHHPLPWLPPSRLPPCPLTYAAFYVCHVAQPMLPMKNWCQVVPPALLPPLSPALSLGHHPLFIPPTSPLFHPPHHCSTCLTVVPPTLPLFHPPCRCSTRLVIVPPTLPSFHPPCHHSTHLAIVPPTSPLFHPPCHHPTHLTIVTPAVHSTIILIELVVQSSKSYFS